MRRFLVMSLLFGALVLLCAGGLLVWAYGFEVRVLRESLRAPGCRVIGVGDSRMETSLDPAGWPGFANFGHSASPLTTSLVKARFICQENPDVQVILVDVWPKAGFFIARDPDFEARERFLLTEVLADFRTAFRQADFLDKFKRNVVLEAFSHLLQRHPVSSVRGGFLPLHKEIRQTKWRDREAFVLLGEESGAAQEPLPEMGQGEKSLREFLVAMRGHRVKVVLLTAPIHPWSRQYRVDASRWALFEQRMQAISAEFQVPWLNYWADERFDDWDLLADCSHLNWRGAERYTKVVRAQVEALFPALKENAGE